MEAVEAKWGYSILHCTCVKMGLQVSVLITQTSAKV